MSEVRNWADNPRLNRWLERQRADFPAWAQETGQHWDFTVESLDRLEELLRKRFASWEEVHAAQDDPAVAVPAWYLGEVQNRHYGTSWYCNPVIPDHPDQEGRPFVQAPAGEEGQYEDDIPPLCNPFSEIRGLFVRSPDEHLRDIVTQYGG
jgi:hypothetical protein